jgi:hypothetical protein
MSIGATGLLFHHEAHEVYPEFFSGSTKVLRRAARVSKPGNTTCLSGELSPGQNEGAPAVLPASI